MTAEDTPDAIPDAPIAQPSVVGAKPRGKGLFGYGVVVMVGIGVLIGMSASREHAAADFSTPAGAATVAFTKPDPLPANATPAALPTPAAPQPVADTRAVPAAPMPLPPMPALPAMPAMPSAAGAASRLAAPAVVVDLGEAPAAGGSLKLADKSAPANPALAGTAKGDATIGDDDSFISRAAARPEQARATRMGKLNAIISEGTIISATLETAINSDLPGLARAVISRDVVSFDGSRLLIPRGSRVIGQYKSGVAMGASRVFVIWTRLIRPDGVSIQLVSPGGDDLGRGGIGGKVDRHFAQRFGGSILMSVIGGAVQAGIASVARSTPVYINSVSGAGTAVTSAASASDIPPTIKAQQGASVKIFVARDLDFSGMDQPQ